jgi:rhodanese-related sulfurtransferase
MAWLKSPSAMIGFSLALVIAMAFLLLHPQAARGGHETEDDVLTVSAEQVKSFLEAREKLVLIDLRPLGDFQKTRLPGARSLPLTELDRRFHEIPKSGRVVLYCDCPQNQIIEQAYQLLKDYGYRNTAVMADAFQEWLRRKYPVETGVKK